MGSNIKTLLEAVILITNSVLKASGDCGAFELNVKATGSKPSE